MGLSGSVSVVPEPPVIRGCGKLPRPCASSGAGRPGRETHSSGPDPQFDPVSPGFSPRPSLCAAAVGCSRGHSQVSPGFSPRPSLCVQRTRRRLYRPAGFAGVLTPAFVVRRRRRPRRSPPRWFRRGSHPGLRCADPAGNVEGVARLVSPGFSPRPSLCVLDLVPESPGGAGFAGVLTPAFVVRGSGCRSSSPARVSPGFSPRPSLCAHPARAEAVLAVDRFAGVLTPAFVVRLIELAKHLRRIAFRRGSHPGLRCAVTLSVASTQNGRFAGVLTPAFVVRSMTVSVRSGATPGVSPGARADAELVDARTTATFVATS